MSQQGQLTLNGGNGPSVTNIGVTTSTPPGTNPVVPDGTGKITFNGIQLAPGTTSNAIQTESIAANTVTIGIQRSQATGVSTVGVNGISHFNSAQFTVDSNGFVSFSGSGGTETLTGNSGGPIGPTANNINTVGTGSITIVGNPGTSTLTTQLTGLTNHNVLVGAGTATITNVSPSATSGVPLISQGASADPTFGTAVVAGGGTGSTSFNINGAVYSNTTTTGVLQAATLSDGQLLIGSSAGAPAAATLTAGSGITITNGHNSISIATSGGGGGITTIAGNSGTATGSTVTIETPTSGGDGTVLFTATSATSTLTFSTASNNNIGLGTNALHSLSTGNNCTAFGVTAGAAITSGQHHTCVGSGAGTALTAGANNTAIGYNALPALTGSAGATGHTAIGSNAMQLYTASGGGGACTAVGAGALNGFTGGTSNVGLGNTAGSGAGGSLTGSNNTFLGTGTGGAYNSSESNNILIGSAETGVLGESNALHIGTSIGLTSAFIGGIAGVTVTSTATVLIDTATSQLGTVVSSGRFKDNIQDLNSSSNILHKMRPVSFNYKKYPNDKWTGLIAEEVHQIAPEYVTYDKEGIPESVQYHKMWGLLINEIQKLRKEVNDLKSQLRVA